MLSFYFLFFAKGAEEDYGKIVVDIPTSKSPEKPTSNIIKELRNTKQSRGLDQNAEIIYISPCI